MSAWSEDHLRANRRATLAEGAQRVPDAVVRPELAS
jgi:hypothetical protein